MPKVLSRKKFQPGSFISITCYKKGCEDVSFRVRMGKAQYIEPQAGFTGYGPGRFNIPAGTPYEVFAIHRKTLWESHSCPNCNTLFGDIIVVNDGEMVFGYDPDPG